MAQQSFSLEDREALWQAHVGVCFYCRHSLDIEAMEIDHFVPESMLDLSPEDRLRELAERGLEPSFDIQGFENLAPSCRPCNSRKTDNRFERGQLFIVLAQLKA